MTTDVVDIVTLKPDAGVVKSLGAHHTFDSAMADLVDNCVDAGATRVSIRLLTQDDRLVQVEVVDNGAGMDAVAADEAMTLGHQRKYGDTDLGHFGIGMKAASFGHCDGLTVWSSRKGSVPVGRRIRRKDYSRNFSCERLSATAAVAADAERRTQLDDEHGTSVVWSDLRSTYRGANVDEARTWMAHAEFKLRSHLGVTFHRLIERGGLTIDVLVDEAADAAGAVGTPVRALDPFGYATSGRPGYPKTIVAVAGPERIALHCHIWPAKVNNPGFRLQGRSGEKFQGFYIYRNDRLLQIGGWSDAANHTPKRQLARVVIDDATVIGRLLTMNPEKVALRFEPQFRDALDSAVAADGVTFDQFLTDAEETYTTANKRRTRRKPVIEPVRGFAPAVRKQIRSELEFTNHDGLDIRWRQMPEGEFFDIDFNESTLLLNQRYRSLLAPGGGSLNDAPLIKALMFLLTHDVFEGTHMGPKDKDNIALWKSILGAAVELEEALSS